MRIGRVYTRTGDGGNTRLVGGVVAVWSWLAMLPILVVCGLFIRRHLLEARLLQQELEGYLDFAQKVRYRLVVGLF